MNRVKYIERFHYFSDINKVNIVYKPPINEDGIFVCENCGSKSRLSTIPNIPGSYKITCFSCKHQTQLKIEEVDESNPLVQEEIIEEVTTPKQEVEKTKKYESIDLKDTKFFEVQTAVSKPFIEVTKITQRLEEISERISALKDIFPSWLNNILKRWYLIALGFLLLLIVSIFIYTKSVYQEVNIETDKLLLELNRHKPTKIMDREGNLVSEIYQKKTGSSKLDDYPKKLVKIILSVEDKNFYSHSGIDYLAFLRASYKNIINFKYIQGASTITQQLARILINDRRKSIGRKFREALVAIALESKLSKDQILEAYLNQVYLGHGAFGIENGAKYYFNKTPNDLKTMEMVLLSSLASAPHKYSPFKNRELSEMRVRQIIHTLESKNIISEKYSGKIYKFYESLVTPEAQTVFGSRYDKAPFVTEHIRELLKSIDPNINIYDLGGYTVETTLHKDVQEFLASEIADHLQSLKDKRKVQRIKVKNTADKPNISKELQAAVIGIDPSTGAVLFMHGGGEEFNSKNQFNRAIQMRRQTGSSIKPILYSAAIDTGKVNAATIMIDAPLLFASPDGGGGWSPDNFGQSYEGEISVRDALAKSKNTIAVQIGEKLGLNQLERYYSSYFFPDIQEKQKRYRNDLSVTLGTLEISPLEMASAYSAFANDGIIKKPYLVKRILDQKGNEIFSNSNSDEFQLKIPNERRVIASDTAEVMVSLMKGSANASGLRKYGYNGEVAGKTGTTNDYIDAWFVGTKPSLSMAVWIGYDDAAYSLGKHGVGAEFAAPLWGRLAKKIYSEKFLQEGKFHFSKRATKLSICKSTGYSATNCNCDDKTIELFTKDSKPSTECVIKNDFTPKLR
jgi:penicillin-binding protein 1A